MYDVTKTVLRIKQRAIQKGIPVLEVMNKAKLSKNTLSNMRIRGSWIAANSLGAIADCLDCSVDYLLGRTDEVYPSGDVIIKTGDVNADNNGDVDVDTSVKITNDTTSMSDDTAELMEMIQSLPLVKRAEAILYIAKLKEN